MEECLFKNTSKMGENEVYEFQSFILKKMVVACSVVIALVCVGAGVGLYFVASYLGIAIAVLGLLGAFVLFPYVMKESVKKNNQQLFNGKKYLNTFEFYDDRVVINCEEAEENSTEYTKKREETILYENLYKFEVHEPYIFIYVDKVQSLLLNEKGMTKGVIADLLEFLKSKGLNERGKKI